MNIVQQLSSQVGDRSTDSNQKVAQQCIANPELLTQITDRFSTTEKQLLGDCAEVFTMVAQENPEIVAPYADQLVPLLSHKVTRVRWEATHALALVAHISIDTITRILPLIEKMIEQDASIIVRDYSIDIVANYSKSSKDAAHRAYPILLNSLSVWDGRHCGHALQGLIYVGSQIPELAPTLKSIGEQYLEHKKGVVRKVAKLLIKSM